MPAPRSSAFTLVELLAAIAIIAALTTASLYFVGGYVQYAQQNADKQTLTVLNDALTRYKGEGGNVSALTAGAPVGNIIARLKTPVTWGGTGPSHQFLQSAVTYPARSLSVLGTGAQYRFTRYNTSTNEPGGVTNPNINGSGSGLVGWWKFNEVSGTAAADSSGNNYTGTVQNPIWVSGHSGNALQFTGSSYVTIPLNANLNSSNTPFTVSVWINAPSYGWRLGIIGDGNYLASGFFLGIDNEGVNTIFFSTNSPANSYGVSDLTPLTATWTNLVGVFDGTKIYLYHNGSLYGSTPASIATSTASSLVIGGGGVQGGWANFVGLIDDVRMYNRALSVSEVSQLYSQ